MFIRRPVHGPFRRAVLVGKMPPSLEDCSWRQVGWNLDDFAKNHFTPEAFENSVRAALKVYEYVWVYTEQPRWWTNERLPKAYVEALRAARPK
jgi:hypothetical protein